MNTVLPSSSSGCPFHQSSPSVSPQARDFDPFSDAYLQSPPDYLRWSREQEPVFYSPVLNYWVVTRYADIKAVFRDNETFSPCNVLEKITPTCPAANQVLKSYDYAMNRTLVNEDEPAHMSRRRLLMEPFTPNALRQHEPLVRDLVRTYVDQIIDKGKADLVEEMLWEVPLTVALHFLGVPEEDMDKLREYSIAHTVNTWGRPDEAEQVKVAHAVGNFWQLAGQILEKMRQDPDQPGWMQYGIRMQKEAPDVVTDSYLHSMMMAGIVAAHETTAHAAANALKLLLENREHWEQLCNEPELIPNAVEECLRLNGSIAAWRRQATRATELGGVQLPEGAKLLIVSSSGNHDELFFNDAQAIDLRRDNASEHLTFGYGSHQCMGKNLARMELQIILEEFTRRLPHMRLAEQTFSYVPNTSFRGPESLWIEWDPSLNPERHNPSLRDHEQAVRIGEHSAKTVSRPVRVTQVETISQGTVRISLQALNGAKLPAWTPGAHLDIECGDPSRTRQYSLCSDVNDEHTWQVAVLHEPDGRGGSNWIHEQVRIGEVLRVRGPRNHFTLNPDSKRLILIAGGIGITPISTMAAHAKQNQIEYELHYSASTRDKMPLLAELQQAHGSRLHLHIKDENSRADYEQLLAKVQPDTQIYVCGPERMLTDLQTYTAHWPDDALRYELFHSTPTTLDPSKEWAFDVELKDSGLQLRVAADQTLLEALRAANIDLQSDCEEGLCGSCEAPLLGGQADHRDHVLSKAERQAQQQIITCCSRAKRGEKLVLAL